MKPVIFLADFVERQVTMLARQRQSFKILSTSVSSKSTHQSNRVTLPCSSVLVPGNFTLLGVFSWSSGCKFYKNGSVLPVSRSMVLQSSQSPVLVLRTVCGCLASMISHTWYVNTFSACHGSLLMVSACHTCLRLHPRSDWPSLDTLLGRHRPGHLLFRRWWPCSCHS